MKLSNILLTTLLTISTFFPAISYGHVHWTRPNDVGPDCVALYHIDAADVTSGALVKVPPPLSADRFLVVQEPAGAAASTSADVAQSILYPYSFRFNSAQTLLSQGVVGGTPNEDLTGDLTIETRFKWHSGISNSTLVFGLKDGPKLQLTFDPVNPANDRFQMVTIEGDIRSAPQFVDWEPYIEHDGGIGAWSHAGLCIYSTGVTYNATREAYEYNAGSIARFYINGHLIPNFSESEVDIAGMAIAETSVIIMECSAGSHTSFDEFTIWTRDWSDNGDNFAPFVDGRGSGTSSVSEWSLY